MKTMPWGNCNSAYSTITCTLLWRRLQRQQSCCCILWSTKHKEKGWIQSQRMFLYIPLEWWLISLLVQNLHYCTHINAIMASRKSHITCIQLANVGSGDTILRKQSHMHRLGVSQRKSSLQASTLVFGSEKQTWQGTHKGQASWLNMRMQFTVCY